MTRTDKDREEELAYRRMEALLKTHLYRRSCPAPEQLSLYQFGLLSPDEKLIIARHVRQCPHCQRELTELARFEESPSLLERLRQAKNLIEAQFIPSPRWQAVGLRGRGHPPQRFRAEELDIHLSQQPGYRHGRWMLLGRLEPRMQPPPAVGGTTIWLIRDEETWEAVVAADGTFAFEELMSGRYDMALEWKDQTVIVRGVQVQ